MLEVAGFNITPVKSTALQRPDVLDLRREGAVGDRRFLFMRDDGSRLSGISKASLMPIQATYDAVGERLTLSFADGGRAQGDARPTGPAKTVALYDRTISVHAVDEGLTRAVRAQIGDDTVTLARADEPDSAGGIHRASILSRASIRDVGRRTGDEALDPRRFRMLIEVEGCHPFEEDTWEGKRVRFGDAVLRIGDRMPRCVMTTLDPDTGVQNARVLDALAQHRKTGEKLYLGMYAEVERPGLIRRGDPVAVLA
ncbi:MAG: MOSC domain-containing protein [Actinomycetota bacterium]